MRTERNARSRMVVARAEGGGSVALDTEQQKAEGVQKAVGVVLAGLGLAAVLSLLGTQCLQFWISCVVPEYVRYTLAAFVALLLAGGGYKKRSLDMSGALSAFCVGWITCGASVAAGVTLVAFFVSSSLFTRFGGKVKEKTDEEFKEGGQRNYVQVLANGGIPTVLAALGAVLASFQQPVFGSQMHGWLPACMCAFIGYYACCCGDTWASELGVLSKTPPRLVTTFDIVPAGTNGGITILGTLASAAGGLWVGMWFFLASLPFYHMVTSAQVGKLMFVIPLGLGAGLVGSFIDSILGATIQFSGYDTIRDKITGTPGPGVTYISGLEILNNHAVNFVSAVLTGSLSATVGMMLM